MLIIYIGLYQVMNDIELGALGSKINVYSLGCGGNGAFVCWWPGTNCESAEVR